MLTTISINNKLQGGLGLVILWDWERKDSGMLTFIMDICPVGFATNQNCHAHQIDSSRVLLLYCNSLTSLHKEERVEPMTRTDSVGLLDRITRYRMEWFNSILYSKFQTLNLLQVHRSKCPSGCKYPIGGESVTISRSSGHHIRDIVWHNYFSKVEV